MTELLQWFDAAPLRTLSLARRTVTGRPDSDWLVTPGLRLTVSRKVLHSRGAPILPRLLPTGSITKLWSSVAAASVPLFCSVVNRACPSFLLFHHCSRLNTIIKTQRQSSSTKQNRQNGQSRYDASPTCPPLYNAQNGVAVAPL